MLVLVGDNLKIKCLREPLKYQRPLHHTVGHNGDDI